MEMRVGAAWYERDQWERLRRVAADPERLEETYEEWVIMAARAMLMAADAGALIMKVPVNVRELIDWCIEQDRPIDSPARAEFTARLLRKRDRSESRPSP